VLVPHDLSKLKVFKTAIYVCMCNSDISWHETWLLWWDEGMLESTVCLWNYAIVLLVLTGSFDWIPFRVLYELHFND
jgi:hypothetical protein